jgi:hypothetical protein
MFCAWQSSVKGLFSAIIPHASSGGRWKSGAGNPNKLVTDASKLPLVGSIARPLAAPVDL